MFVFTFANLVDALGHRNKILRGIQALKNPFWQHVLSTDDDTVGIPEELFCPITHELMQDPVVAKGEIFTSTL
jgi:U-box domain